MASKGGLGVSWPQSPIAIPLGRCVNAGLDGYVVNRCER